MVKARVSIKSAPYRDAPDTRSGLVYEISRGQTLTLHGRSHDGAWLTPTTNGQLWLHISHLALEGDVTALPVVPLEADADAK